MQQDIEIGKGLKDKLEGYRPNSVPDVWPQLAANMPTKLPWYQLPWAKYSMLSIVLVSAIIGWLIITPVEVLNEPMKTNHKFPAGDRNPEEITNQVSLPLDPPSGDKALSKQVSVDHATQGKDQLSAGAAVSDQQAYSPVTQRVGNSTGDGKKKQISRDQNKGRDPVHEGLRPGLGIQSIKSKPVIPMISQLPENDLWPVDPDFRRSFASKYFLELGLGPNLNYGANFHAYHIGGGYSVRIINNFALNIGLTYHQYKNVKRSTLITASNTIILAEKFHKLRYLNMPVGLSYQTGIRGLGAHFQLLNTFTFREFDESSLHESSILLSLKTFENKHRFYLASGLSFGLTYPIYVMPGLIMELRPSYYLPLRALGTQKIEAHFLLGLRLRLRR